MQDPKKYAYNPHSALQIEAQRDYIKRKAKNQDDEDS